MAKASDQFRSGDVTFWGIVALAVWGVAVIGANLSALVPDSVLGALHASRLEGASLNQMRTQFATIESQSAALKQENTVLLQRLLLNEQANGEATRRIGALEISVPKLIESLNAEPGVDRGSITASTGRQQVTTFDTDGGSVSYSTSPLVGVTAVQSGSMQVMPQVLPDVSPDPASFGIALGPPIDANEAEGAWQSLNVRVGTLLLGLGPILGHVEGGAGRRIVAGPISSEADAREMCGRMAKVGVACASVPFIGDPLPLLN